MGASIVLAVASPPALAPYGVDAASAGWLALGGLLLWRLDLARHPRDAGFRVLMLSYWRNDVPSWQWMALAVAVGLLMALCLFVGFIDPGFAINTRRKMPPEIAWLILASSANLVLWYALIKPSVLKIHDFQASSTDEPKR